MLSRGMAVARKENTVLSVPGYTTISDSEVLTIKIACLQISRQHWEDGKRYGRMQ